MLFALASLLLVTLSQAVSQQPEAPTFQIETLRGQDGSPLAGCEVLVLQDAMDESDENIALFLQHGLQLAERLEAKGVRYRTGESGRLESRHGLRDIVRD